MPSSCLKGKSIKIEVDIDGEKTQLIIEKQCSMTDCDCPAEFAYLYPPDYANDKLRWVAGFIRTQHVESRVRVRV